MLQDEIKKISGYFRGIEYFNDAIIVKVIFPTNWQVYPSPDGNIKPAKSDKTLGEYYYYGDMNKVSLDDLFELVEETIIANKDAEMKIELLSNKIAELKEIFKTTPYDKLINLQFVMKEEKAKEKPKRKYNKKKKKEEETPLVEETVNADDENKNEKMEE